MTAFPTFGANAKSRKITTPQGVTMRVVGMGDGADVIFVPGGDSRADAYANLFARLLDRFRCIGYDPRGRGTRSPRPLPGPLRRWAPIAPPSMCKIVSGLAPNGHFHEIPELGHVSQLRRRPDIVATKLREIMMDYSQ